MNDAAGFFRHGGIRPRRPSPPTPLPQAGEGSKPAADRGVAGKPASPQASKSANLQIRPPDQTTVTAATPAATSITCVLAVAGSAGAVPLAWVLSLWNSQLSLAAVSVTTA